MNYTTTTPAGLGLFWYMTSCRISIINRLLVIVHARLASGLSFMNVPSLRKHDGHFETLVAPNEAPRFGYKPQAFYMSHVQNS